MQRDWFLSFEIRFVLTTLSKCQKGQRLMRLVWIFVENDLSFKVFNIFSLIWNKFDYTANVKRNISDKSAIFSFFLFIIIYCWFFKRFSFSILIMIVSKLFNSVDFSGDELSFHWQWTSHNYSSGGQSKFHHPRCQCLWQHLCLALEGFLFYPLAQRSSRYEQFQRIEIRLVRLQFTNPMKSSFVEPRLFLHHFCEALGIWRHHLCLVLFGPSSCFGPLLFPNWKLT